MLRRASDLAARARERIRAAREHDPHGWPERDDDRALLTHEDVYNAEPIDFVQSPTRPGTRPRDADAGPDRRPPLGSPEPGAPDVDGAVGAGGVSGPPAGRSPAPARGAFAPADVRRRPALRPPRTASRTACGRRPRGRGG